MVRKQVGLEPRAEDKPSRGGGGDEQNRAGKGGKGGSEVS